MVSVCVPALGAKTSTVPEAEFEALARVVVELDPDQYVVSVCVPALGWKTMTVPLDASLALAAVVVAAGPP